MTVDLKHSHEGARIGTPSTAHTVSAAAAAAMHRLACIFIDARPRGLHKLERIAGAMSFPGEAASVPDLPQRPCTVVVYDSGSTSLDQKFSRAAAVIRSLMALRPNDTRFCLLAGGIPEIRAVAPALLETALACDAQVLDEFRTALASKPAWATEALDMLANSATPAAQILPWLYLGSAADACKLARLESFGVTHILNMAAECIPSFPNRYVYKHIPAHDRGTYDMANCFPSVCEFLHGIQQCYNRGENVCVLVHCYAGLSRSVAAVVAFLMAHQQCSLSDALIMVQKRRKGASPTNFMSQLRQWEIESLKLQNPVKDTGLSTPNRTNNCFMCS